PRKAHDRVIVVRLQPDKVEVEYRLEVDEWTVVFVDLPAVSDKVDLAKLKQPREFYEAFTRCYSPILADNLVATLAGKPLEFTCVKDGHEVADSLRCNFVFQAPCNPGPGEKHSFTFQEGNYELETGLIRLSLEAAARVKVLAKTEPDEELKNR